MSKEQQFWDWFKQNETKYYFLNQIDDEEEKEKHLDNFFDHLHEYCENLFFMVGGQPDEKQDLIITAEGNTNFFGQVEALVEQAPLLEHWNVIAFKPAQADHKFKVKHEGIELDPQTLYFIPLNSKKSDQIGLRIYLDSYDSTRKQDFLTVAYWVLDNILGEKSSALDIGYVEIEALPPYPEREELIELTKLPQYINWKKGKSKTSS
jgi:hypothetical protein